MHLASKFPLLISVIVCCAYHVRGSLTKAHNDGRFQQFIENEIELRSNRLPPHVRPVKYAIELDLTDSFGEPSEVTSYTGSVQIDVEFCGPLKRPDNWKTTLVKVFACGCGTQEASSEQQCSHDINRIVLHADESVQIDGVLIMVDGPNEDSKQRQLLVMHSARDKQKQLIVLDVEKLPRSGTGSIWFNFRADVGQHLHGVYSSTIKRQESMHRFIVAALNPMFARLALPCFDEPSFKAKFELAITYPESVNGQATHAYSNMDELVTTYKTDIQTTVFKPTPLMSIHELAFSVGNFDEDLLVVKPRDNLKLRFLAAPGLYTEGEFALEVAAATIEYMEQYLERPFPLDKLDILALGDSTFDNMESWGLAYVRDHIICLNQESHPASKAAAAAHVAHVVIHQWFANLVTVNYWDDLWISESVATHLAYKVVERLYPQTSTIQLARLKTLSPAMAMDEWDEMHPISIARDSSALDTLKLYDLMTLMKSGAIAGMLEAILGKNTYKALLQLILKRYAYDNLNRFEFLDMVAELVGSGTSEMDLAKRMINSYTRLSGLPLVNVALSSRDNTKLIVYSESLSTAKQQIDTSGELEQAVGMLARKWFVPLRALISGGGGSSDNEQIIPIEQDVAKRSVYTVTQLPDWFEPVSNERHFIKLSPNPDLSVYYRVRYSDQLLKQLHVAIREKMMPAADRMQILDDYFTFSQLDLSTHESFKDLFAAYANEDDPLVILSMLNAAAVLDEQTQFKSTDSKAFRVFLKLYTEHGFKVTGNETVLEQLVRTKVLRMLVDKGVRQVINGALEVFGRGTEIAPFLREPVYAAVVKAGTREQAYKLTDRLLESSSIEERTRLAVELSVSRDRPVLEGLMYILNEPYDFKWDAQRKIVSIKSGLTYDDEGNIVVDEDMLARK